MSKRTIEEIQKKNRFKVVKVIVQVAFILTITLLLIKNNYWYDKYEPYQVNIQEEENKVDHGFIAVSYLGIEKIDSGEPPLIASNRLDEHLKALYESGYKTISQKDIKEYLEGKKNLPEKAMFLMFEDGRKDTAIFVQKSLERYNFLATIMTYAERFVNTDPKFLTARDIRRLEENTYWEMGSNGYRLAYINVFDQYDNYFGNLNSDQFVVLNQYLRRDYNHYLMDFYRDTDWLPLETELEMSVRIAKDYALMQQIYEEKYDKMPMLYTLMHSNTGQFATEERVSVENEKNINKYFSMNFNREGDSLNDRETNCYDLTRMQPQPHWYTNHVLMRLADDTGQEMAFVQGDKVEHNKWIEKQGKAEFKDYNTIVLTTEPDTVGEILYKNHLPLNYRLQCKLGGNKAGGQGFYLRASEDLTSALSIVIENNILKVEQISNGKKEELYRLDLFEFDGGATQSLEENEHEGLLAYQDAIIKFDDDSGRIHAAKEDKEEIKGENPRGIAEGDEEYIPYIDIQDTASRQLEILLEDEYVSIRIDGRIAIRNLLVSNDISKSATHFALHSSVYFDEYSSQRNIFDDVYDAVFEDIMITDLSSEKNEIYSYVREAIPKLYYKLTEFMDKVQVFFIEHF